MLILSGKFSLESQLYILWIYIYIYNWKYFCDGLRDIVYIQIYSHLVAYDFIEVVVNEQLYIDTYYFVPIVNYLPQIEKIIR